MDSNLLPDQKLAILQALDLRRKWHSFDDHRVCVLCNRAITGRQITVIGDATGSFSARCPTEGCTSAPGDWFYHGSASVSAKAPTNRTGEFSLWE